MLLVVLRPIFAKLNLYGIVIPYKLCRHLALSVVIETSIQQVTVERTQSSCMAYVQILRQTNCSWQQTNQFAARLLTGRYFDMKRSSRPKTIVNHYRIYYSEASRLVNFIQLLIQSKAVAYIIAVSEAINKNRIAQLKKQQL